MPKNKQYTVYQQHIFDSFFIACFSLQQLLPTSLLV